MKKVLLPTLFFAAFIIISCSNKPADIAKPSFELLQKVNWLLGKWGNISPQGTMVEAWSQKNDSTFAGKTHFVIGADTVFTETISLEQRGKELFYVTQIADQNQGKPVSFKMTTSNDKKVVFENPTHDFPQKITYTKVGSDSLIAEISGKDKGKVASEKFPMGKLK